MKKNYNYNYVNRVNAKPAIDFAGLELASCKSSVLKNAAIINIVTNTIPINAIISPTHHIQSHTLHDPYI